ncbi:MULTISPECIES: Clp protease N-terminal domain-containing protein [unclassified Streptosporangium]|uniref:Clp protease N-terminal domain-containing protein n=1 Tax=unclassified Streptosporangium TaxID=2632669 RepID=UPI002E2E242F|nr:MULTISPECIES: Clp protease N-terminal domain-containing protein [unclassified Streptosporangium]
MFERFTAGARAAVVAHAPAEARRRGDRRIGTEHLLLGVLHEAEAAQALGADVESARSALAVLDDAALAAVGVDAHGVERAMISAPSKRMPFTSGAKAALSRAIAVARRSPARRVTAVHLLVGLLDGDRTDPASDVLTELGVDRVTARARLAP